MDIDDRGGILDWLETKIGLHQTLEIDYIVDGYSVALIEGQWNIMAEAEGKTIKEALENLRCKLQ